MKIIILELSNIALIVLRVGVIKMHFIEIGEQAQRIFRERAHQRDVLGTFRHGLQQRVRRPARTIN